MSFVLVDAPSVVATLIASGAPRPVQVVISGVSTGQSVTVTPVAGGVASTLPVPGGVIPSAPGGQIVLIDNRTGLNVPVHYQVVIDGVTYLSNEVVVDYLGRHVLQSLDGRTTVAFRWRRNGIPQEVVTRAAAFDVPGRDRPPVRFDTGGDGGGVLEVRTGRADSVRLRDLLKSGRPLAVRTDGTMRDFPTTELILPTGGTSYLWEELTATGPSADRVWTIPYLLVDDPEPSAAVSAFTWDDFDAAMVGRTWDDFDALFAASTWDDFDTYQWTQL